MARTRKGAPSIADGMDAPMTQDEIAEVLHISRQLVSVIEKRAIEKLRRNPKLRRIFEQMKQQQEKSYRISEPRAARAVNLF